MSLFYITLTKCPLRVQSMCNFSKCTRTHQKKDFYVHVVSLIMYISYLHILPELLSWQYHLLHTL